MRKAAKPGRGRRPIADPATSKVELRLVPSRKAAYQRAARKAGVTLSAWLRMVADEALADDLT